MDVSKTASIKLSGKDGFRAMYLMVEYNLFDKDKTMIKKTSIQMVKYVGVGGTAALVEWSGFAVLIGFTHLHYLVAVAVIFIVATAVNYVLSARFVFVRGRHPAHRELFLIYLVSAIGLVLNLLLMSFFVGYLSIPPMPAKIASTGVVFFWNFSARKIWIFEK